MFCDLYFVFYIFCFERLEAIARCIGVLVLCDLCFVFTFSVLRGRRQLHGVLAFAGHEAVATNCFVFVPFIVRWSGLRVEMGLPCSALLCFYKGEEEGGGCDC